MRTSRPTRLMRHRLAILPRRYAHRLLERYAKTIGDLIAAHPGQHLYLVVGLAQQLLGAVHPDAMDLLTRSPVQPFKKRLVQSAPRHAADAHQILHADGLMA